MSILTIFNIIAIVAGIFADGVAIGSRHLPPKIRKSAILWITLTLVFIIANTLISNDIVSIVLSLLTFVSVIFVIIDVCNLIKVTKSI